MHDQDVGTSDECLVSEDSSLKAAMREHRAGRWDEAAALYEAILARDEANGLALHLLGVVYHRRGDHERAIALLELAASLRPDDAAIPSSLAEVCLALGRHERAAEQARQALWLGPDDPKTLYVLGLALHALRGFDEAVAMLRQAVDLDPSFAAAHNSLGNALRSLGRLAEARTAYLEARRLAPDLAVVHCNLGLIFLFEGQFENARQALVRATELEPNQPFYWERLAEFYQWRERFDEAIPCWERVLALTPDTSSRPHLALGRALHERHRPADAEVHFQRAAAINPGSAAAQLNLGRLHQERGDFVAAEAAFRNAIRIEPTLALAHVRLATLLGARLPAADLAALTARLDDPNTADEPRARLLFALGHVLDARQEYSPAARHLRQANALSLAQLPIDRRLAADTVERFVSQSIRAFGPDFFGRAAGAGLDTLRPVFIVGLPRSGTTLIEQVLASHPQVAGAGELDLGQWAYQSLPSLVNCAAPPLDCVAQLQPAMISQLARAYLDRLQELVGAGAARVVDKMPENFKHLGLLVALFPRATIIHCRRDFRDVALSCWMADFLHISWANDPAQIASTFGAYRRLMDHWQSVLPTTIHTVDYEETVSDLEPVAQRLLSVLGLDWHPACLKFHHTRRVVRSGSITQVRQPLYQSSVGRWKNYAHELSDLFDAVLQAV
ncbi:MAG: tetratricopeptide repeat protein [Isosphaeraceae bacterium]|nr:tetratricopeptide repeat protein [Isosphaeraceae bacterium]